MILPLSPNTFPSQYRICVLGLGYIGLPTAAMFASHGFQVVGVDVNDRIVEVLSNGEVHIQERGLRTLVQAALKSGNLRVARQPEPADAFIIAVPTPLSLNHNLLSDAENATNNQQKVADISYVISAAESIVPHLRSGNLVVLESTVPPRTTVDILLPILENSGLKVRGNFGEWRNEGEKEHDNSARHTAISLPPQRSKFYLAHCPERVLPGHILEELVSNDRVIGGVDQDSSEMAKALYASFVEGDIFLTDVTTAELVKLMENTYRDVNIALANELALVAEQVGISVWDAIELANYHPRVNILKPGPGVGGHCIAVDPWFILQAAPNITPLIRTARQVNDEMPAHVVKMVKQIVEDIERPVIACLGLAYKAEVDDTRESPALKVIQKLVAAGFQIRAFDPYIEEPVFLHQATSFEETVSGADCLVFLTDHKMFCQIDPVQVAPLMRDRRVLASRNCISRSVWKGAGFNVTVLGESRESLKERGQVSWRLKIW